MLATNPRLFADDERSLVRAAFLEVHGRRLHGFGLLLTLGDAPRAAQLAAETLSAAADHLDELRHPERAAAWLRARMVASAARMRPTSRRTNERRGPLADLGAGPAVVAGLLALSLHERAALIASSLERLDRRDVETVVGRRGTRLERILNRARRRYAAAYAAAAPEPRDAGPMTTRVRAIAERALG